MYRSMSATMSTPEDPLDLILADCVCRLCLSEVDPEDTNAMDMFATRDGVPRVSTQLEFLFQLRFEESHVWPSIVCSDCVEFLARIKEFKGKILLSHCTLYKNISMGGKALDNVESPANERDSPLGDVPKNNSKGLHSTYTALHENESIEYKKDPISEDDIKLEAASECESEPPNALQVKDEDVSPGDTQERPISTTRWYKVGLKPRNELQGMEKMSSLREIGGSTKDPRTAQCKHCRMIFPTFSLLLRHALRSCRNRKIATATRTAKAAPIVKVIEKEKWVLERTPEEEKKLEQVMLSLDVLRCSAEGCNENFTRLKDLEDHIQKYHYKENNIYCCESLWPLRASAMDHMAYHLDPAVFKCNTCGMRFKTYQNLYHHTENIHSTPAAKVTPAPAWKKTTIVLERTPEEEQKLATIPAAKVTQTRPPSPIAAQAWKNTTFVLERTPEEEKKLENVMLSLDVLRCTAQGCYDNFARLMDLEDHIQKYHPKDNNIYCCESLWPLRRSAMNHMAYHLDPKAFKKNTSGLTNRNLCQQKVEKVEALRNRNWLIERTPEENQKLEQVMLSLDVLRCTAEGCYDNFTRLMDLEDHIQKVHPKDNNIYCCKNLWPLRASAMDHMAYHLDPDEFKCNTCGMRFKTYENLYHHKKNIHFTPAAKVTRIRTRPPSPLEAPACKNTTIVSERTPEEEKKLATIPAAKVTQTRPPSPLEAPAWKNTTFVLERTPEEEQKLEQVMRSLDVLRCTAESCIENFIQLADLEDHIQKLHPKDNNIYCCKSLWSLRASAMDHMAYHLDPDAFKCNNCGKQCPSYNHLRHHESRVHRKRRTDFKCETCKKEFKYHQSLQQHRFTHLPVEKRPFLCKYCGKGFVKYGYLKVHIHKHHEIEDRYMCDKCGQSFSNWHDFRDHRRREELKEKSMLPKKKKKIPTEADKEIVTCEICGKSIEKYKLSTHKLDHKYIPKDCDICGTFLKSRHTYHKHMSNHRGNFKSYRCPHCSEVFPSVTSRHHEIRRHHPAEFTLLAGKKILD